MRIATRLPSGAISKSLTSRQRDALFWLNAALGGALTVVTTLAAPLVALAFGQPELAPKAKSATVFEFAPARLEVQFDSASSFTLKQMGKNFKYKKVVTQ